MIAILIALCVVAVLFVGLRMAHTYCLLKRWRDKKYELDMDDEEELHL